MTTVQEAGRKGGETTSERYGREFYEEIGRKGGKKGGNVTKERYGHEFYDEIGRMSAAARAEKRAAKDGAQ